MEFQELPPDIKASNTAAAARIPSVLSLVGLRLVPVSAAEQATEKGIRKLLDQNIELLAEAEHNGWWEDKLRNGWAYSPRRDNNLKLHPSMVFFAQLSEEDKEKDRDAVRKYPDVVKKAGYMVVRVDGK